MDGEGSAGVGASGGEYLSVEVLEGVALADFGIADQLIGRMYHKVEAVDHAVATGYVGLIELGSPSAVGCYNTIGYIIICTSVNPDVAANGVDIVEHGVAVGSGALASG